MQETCGSRQENAQGRRRVWCCLNSELKQGIFFPSASLLLLDVPSSFPLSRPVSEQEITAGADV